MTGAEVWIERVRLDLRSPLDRGGLGQGEGALGELVRWVDELASDAPALEEFCRKALAEVLGKVPAEVMAALAHEGGDASAASDIPRLDDPAGLMALLADAEATLLARLNIAEPLPP